MNNRMKNISATIFSSMISKIITIGLSIISIPMSIRYFGNENYGSMIIVLSLVNFMQLLGLSLGGVVNTIGAQLATEYKNDILLKKILKHFLPFICIVLFTFISFYPEFWSYIVKTFYAGKINEVEFEKVFFYAGLNILLSAVIVIFQSVFNAIKKIYIVNIYQLIGTIFSFGALVFTVNKKLSMENYFMIIFMLNLIIGLISIIHLILLLFFNKEKKVILEENDILKLRYRNIYITSFSATSIAIISIIISQTDYLIIPYFLNNADLVVFNISFKFISYELIVYSIIFSSVIPHIGEWFHNEKWDEIKNMYDRVTIISICLGFLVVSFNMIFLKDFVNVWLKKSVEIDIIIIMLLSVYFFCFGLYSANYIIYSTFNVKRKVMIILSVIEPLLKIFISYILIKHFALIGAALSVMILGLVVTLPITSVSLRYFSENKVTINAKIISASFFLLVLEIISLYFISNINIFKIKYFIGLTETLIILIVFLIFIQKNMKIEILRKKEGKWKIY